MRIVQTDDFEAPPRPREMLAANSDRLRRRLALLWGRAAAAQDAAMDSRAHAACLWAECRVLAGEMRAANGVPSGTGSGRPPRR